MSNRNVLLNVITSNKCRRNRMRVRTANSCVPFLRHILGHLPLRQSEVKHSGMNSPVIGSTN